MNRPRIKRILGVIVIPFLFFTISFLTLSDYGISWDEPIHFQRGQAYLYYFLTGKTTYKDLPLIKEYVPKIEGLDIGEVFVGKKVVRESSTFRRSFYQHESLNGEWFLVNDSGHPPLNGILAALFNKIFYQKLGIMGDVESHHLFIVVSATLLVLVVCIFAYQTYGLFASAIAGLSLSLYPLFFSEAHFNIKDPPEAAFYGLTIWTFWMSLNKKSWKWLLISILGFSLALGTKFNILFLPVILLPYLILRYWKFLRKSIKRPISIVGVIPKLYLLLLILAPFIVALIFFGTWPYLWQDLWVNTIQIFKFYRDIGMGHGYQPGYFLPGGFNIYPLVWIATTTPVWMFFLTVVGVVSAARRWRDWNYAPLLWLLWFLVPILRVSLPNTTVYGGIRQIMEYVPAMALLAGMGVFSLAKYIVDRTPYFRLTTKKIKELCIRLLFLVLTLVFLLYPVVKYHPNENVYFNFLVGGLSGARDKNIPSWGNSFGNAYYQAVAWINKNVEKDAKLSLIQGTLQNISGVYPREDIRFWNGYWSGIARGGEYLVELTYQDPSRAYPYAWDYVDKFLNTVYEVKVDGVPIAKVWKNDWEHTKPEYRKVEKPFGGRVGLRKDGNAIYVSLSRRVMLSHFTLVFNKTSECDMSGSSQVAISSDGQNWLTKLEPIPFPQISAKISLDGNVVNYYFPSEEAAFIKVSTKNINSCLLDIKSFNVTILE